MILLFCVWLFSRGYVFAFLDFLEVACLVLLSLFSFPVFSNFCVFCVYDGSTSVLRLVFRCLGKLEDITSVFVFPS